MEETGEYIVVVGVVPGTARGSYEEFAGTNEWGPFTAEEAFAFAARVDSVWEKQLEEAFVYGTPLAEVKPLVHSNQPMYDPAAVAARNWYLEVEDVDQS